MGNITSLASASHIRKKYETNPRIVHFRNFSNLNNLSMISKLPKRNWAQHKVDYPKVGLGILISLIDETKPFVGAFNGKKHIVFGTQKMNIALCQRHFYANSSPRTFLVRTTNRIPIPSPKVSGRNAVISVRQQQPFYTCVLRYHCCKFYDSRYSARPKRKIVRVDSYCGSSSFDIDLGNVFLKICCTCKQKLKENEDIYIYKGEFSFCSNECRIEKIIADEMEIAAKKAYKKTSSTTSNYKRIFNLE